MNIDLAWVRYKVGMFFSEIKTGGGKWEEENGEYILLVCNRRCDCGVFLY